MLISVPEAIEPVSG